MITKAIFTTDPVQAQAYFQDGKLWLDPSFNIKRFTEQTITVQMDATVMEDLYNEEVEATQFLFTCLRRFNEVVGGKVQGFRPDALLFMTGCFPFTHQSVSIPNLLADLIGWETTFDPDEPRPITDWKVKPRDAQQEEPDQPQQKTDTTGKAQLQLVMDGKVLCVTAMEVVNV